jgi:hypothetical protein
MRKKTAPQPGTWRGCGTRVGAWLVSQRSDFCFVTCTSFRIVSPRLGAEAASLYVYYSVTVCDYGCGHWLVNLCTWNVNYVRLVVVRIRTCNDNILSDLWSYVWDCSIKYVALPIWLFTCYGEVHEYAIVDVGWDVCRGQPEREYLWEQLRTKEKKFGRNVVPRYYVAGIY